MPIALATESALVAAARRDQSFIRDALTRAASGDASALKSLTEATGIDDAAQIKEAAALFVAHDLDLTLSTTGANRPPTFSLTQGGVSAQKMSAFIGLRSVKVPENGVAGTLRSLVEQRDPKRNERDARSKERTAAAAELEALHLNRRERLLGSWAGVLGGSGGKGDRGEVLKGEIARLDKQIAGLDREIAGLESQMHDATAKHLGLQCDATFAALDQKEKAARAVVASVASLAAIILAAENAVEAAREADTWQTLNLQRGSTWKSLDAGQAVIDAIKVQLPVVELALRAFGEAGVSGTPTDAGVNRRSWIFGDGISATCLHSALDELDGMAKGVGTLKAKVRQPVDDAMAARAAYLEQTEARLLGG